MNLVSLVGNFLCFLIFHRIHELWKFMKGMFSELTILSGDEDAFYAAILYNLLKIINLHDV